MPHLSSPSVVISKTLLLLSLVIYCLSSSDAAYSLLLHHRLQQSLRKRVNGSHDGRCATVTVSKKVSSLAEPAPCAWKDRQTGSLNKYSRTYGRMDEEDQGLTMTESALVAPQVPAASRRPWP